MARFVDQRRSWMNSTWVNLNSRRALSLWWWEEENMIEECVVMCSLVEVSCPQCSNSLCNLGVFPHAPFLYNSICKQCFLPSVGVSCFWGSLPSLWAMTCPQLFTSLSTSCTTTIWYIWAWSLWCLEIPARQHNAEQLSYNPSSYEHIRPVFFALY